MAPKKPIEKATFPHVVESAIENGSGPEALYAALDLGTNSCRMLIAHRKALSFTSLIVLPNLYNWDLGLKKQAS